MGHPLQTSKSPLIFGAVHPDMAYWLGPSLRACDQLELSCTSGIHGPAAYQLQDALETAPEDTAIVSDRNGTIHGVFGHGPMPPSDHDVGGYIWLLGTEELFQKYAKTATRLAKKAFLPHVLEIYGSVGNYVHSDNSVHLRWLQRLGFEAQGQYEINGEPFTLMKL